MPRITHPITQTIVSGLLFGLAAFATAPEASAQIPSDGHHLSQRHSDSGDRFAGALIGGLLGGVIGNGTDSGVGTAVGAVGGALAGAAIADSGEDRFEHDRFERDRFERDRFSNRRFDTHSHYDQLDRYSQSYHARSRFGNRYDHSYDRHFGVGSRRHPGFGGGSRHHRKRKALRTLKALGH